MGTINLQIPQLNFPNSSEDPKIASDLTTIQTVINGGLDHNNLNASAGITFGQLATGASFPNRLQIATSGTANLNYGDFCILEAAIIVNFPAANSGKMVAVLNAASGGANPSPLNGTGGAQLFVGGAFDTTIDMPSGSGKCWTFLSDGTNWLLVSTNSNP